MMTGLPIGTRVDHLTGAPGSRHTVRILLPDGRGAQRTAWSYSDAREACIREIIYGDAAGTIAPDGDGMGRTPAPIPPSDTP